MKSSGVLECPRMEGNGSEFFFVHCASGARQISKGVVVTFGWVSQQDAQFKQPETKWVLDCFCFPSLSALECSSTQKAAVQGRWPSCLHCPRRSPTASANTRRRSASASISSTKACNDDLPRATRADRSFRSACGRKSRGGLRSMPNVVWHASVGMGARSFRRRRMAGGTTDVRSEGAIPSPALARPSGPAPSASGRCAKSARTDRACRRLRRTRSSTGRMTRAC